MPIWLPIPIFVAALLYASVGHAGASGYLAVLALTELAPAAMKPTALVLNILVSTVVVLRFWRAQLVPWRALLPFALASVPCAFLGGWVALPGQWYRWLVGLVLLYSAFRLGRRTGAQDAAAVKLPPTSVALATGSGIGLLAGLTGTGGGIFLSPLAILRGWATPRQAAGLSGVFIWLNSVAGLLGNWQSVALIPSATPVWAIAAVLGGTIGAGLGARRLPPIALRRLLALVLVVASAKLLLAK